MVTITLEDELTKSQDEPSSIEGMTAFGSPNVDEVSTQVKYKNEMYRSRFDFFLSLCQHNARSRSIGCPEPPPQSSKLHAYFSRKSSVYHTN